MKFDENFYGNADKILEEFNLPNLPIFREWVHNHLRFCQTLDNGDLVDYKENIKYAVSKPSTSIIIDPQITNDGLKDAGNEAIKKTFGIHSYPQHEAQVIYDAYFKNECLVIECTTIVYKDYNSEKKQTDILPNDSCQFYTSCEVYDKEATDIIINMLKNNVEEQIKNINDNGNRYFGQYNLEDYYNTLACAANCAKNELGLKPDEKFDVHNNATKYHDAMQLLDERINSLNNIEQEKHRTAK